MNLLQLVLRSLAFHRRSHLGVVLGGAVATAVIVGALVVGDSLQSELQHRALLRLGSVIAGHDGRDRFFSTAPGHLGSLEGQGFQWAAALRLPGVAVRQDGTARANRIQVLGVDEHFFRLTKPSSGTHPPAADRVLLNRALAQQLGAKPGDALVLRLHKPTALSLDAIVSPRDEASIALRVTVEAILPDDHGGAFDLGVGQSTPFNAFVGRDVLQRLTALEARANLLLAGPESNPNTESLATATRAATVARDHTTLADLELAVRIISPQPSTTGGEPAQPSVEVSTRRIFLDPSAAEAALGTTEAPSLPTPVTIATYLVNTLRNGDRMVPYSMVTAAGAPYTPPDLQDDEIVVNEWLAQELGTSMGSTVTISWYEADSAARLVERTNLFRVRSIVPLKGLWADRTLMPEFPGLSKAESTHDWDAGFELIHKVRDQDETYWKQWRGTPKAWITPSAGRKMWANRFGTLTAVRWLIPPGTDPSILSSNITARLRSRIDPTQLGLALRPVREEALSGARNGTAQMFVGLFIGFSLFLIVSALLLTSLLFRFGLEQRAGEIGILLALGWRPERIRRLHLLEGAWIAGIAAVPGAFLGLAYARGILWALNHVWNDAIAGMGVTFAANASSVGAGMIAGAFVALLTLWVTLRHLARRSARELLNEGANGTLGHVHGGRLLPSLASGAAVATFALAAAGWSADTSARPGLFFGAGTLFLIACLLGLRHRLSQTPSQARGLSRAGFAWRAPARQPGRSTATVTLLASATFLIIALAAFRLDARRDASKRSGGTGGFTFWGESSMPILHDPGTPKGRENLGLTVNAVEGVEFALFRVRDGDDASCLNLSRAARPRILGTDPARLAARHSFTFSGFAAGVDASRGWSCLEGPEDADIIPAVGDAASIQYALQKKLGDTLELEDGRGRRFQVRLVAAVANSVLQGNLVIDERAFRRRFPGESGHRLMWVDAPPQRADTVRTALSRAMGDQGLELTPMVERLERFNAVQNTYLGTFQVLGGLGLLLGSAGLGIVVLRNVHERRGELAVLRAVGFGAHQVRRMVLTEHVILVLLGLGIGCLAAVVAVIPLLSGDGGLPWATLVPTLFAVGVNGFLCAWIATRYACQGGLLDALRGE